MQVFIPITEFLPHYRSIINSTKDINLLYGGRDSGKSHFIAQKMIFDCLSLPYFRCLLIKKTYNSIRESQWQTIKDVVEAWGFESLFEFNKSPMMITCKNGNRFIARGCDDPQSIKSTKDPSHAWYEEGNQLTLNDFITVTTTLRTNKTKVQQWFSFNPECEGDYEDFWLYQIFFEKQTNKSFSGVWKMGEQNDVKFEYNVLHSTYHNNKHCSPSRRIFLEQLKEISPYYYTIYTLGHWGRAQNKSPFVYAFDKKRHVAPTQYRFDQELYVSFDFNRNPICASCYQYYGGTLYGIESIKIENSNIYELCDVIKRKYPGAVLMVTGDATGRAGSALARDDMNYYRVIKQELSLSNAQLKVPTVNPPIKENQVLVNAVLMRVPCVFDGERCKELIFDFKNVRVLADGGIDKADRNDPTKQADQLDTFRYMCNTFFKWVLKQ